MKELDVDKVNGELCDIARVTKDERKGMPSKTVFYNVTFTEGTPEDVYKIVKALIKRLYPKYIVMKWLSSPDTIYIEIL